jgi:hypothetical protein
MGSFDENNWIFNGALARSDYHRALQMLANKPVNAVELSALRQDELQPLVEHLDNLDLGKFSHKAFHASSSMDPSFEPLAIKLLEQSPRGDGRSLFIPMQCTRLRRGPTSVIFFALRIWTNESPSVRQLRT